MKTALVTGANRGLGLGFVKHLLANNFRVIATMRSLEDFNYHDQKNINLHCLELDVSSDASISQCYEETKKIIPSLDFLINNAGINKDSATNNHKELVCNLDRLDRKALQDMFNVNSISPLIVTKQFLPLLKAVPSFVVNISSCRASFHDEFENTTGNYGYRASKIALNMLTYCTLYDLPTNVKTFTVHPGGVKSDMNPKGEDDATEQAAAIIKIAEDWNDAHNGKFMRYDGTLYPL